MKRVKIKTLKKQIKNNPIFDKRFKDGLFVSNFFKKKGTAIWLGDTNDKQIEELRKMGYITPMILVADEHLYYIFILEPGNELGE